MDLFCTDISQGNALQLLEGLQHAHPCNSHDKCLFISLKDLPPFGILAIDDVFT